MVHSKRIRWSGDRTEPRGYWLKTTIYTDSEGKMTKGFEEQREITKEPTKYTELKHGQIVKIAGGCAKKGNSLEDLSSAIEEIF